MSTITTQERRAREGDDIAFWPDGTWATLWDVSSGDYDDKSDDYEVVPYDDIARLTELGIAEALGLEVDDDD